MIRCRAGILSVDELTEDGLLRFMKDRRDNAFSWSNLSEASRTQTEQVIWLIEQGAETVRETVELGSGHYLRWFVELDCDDKTAVEFNLLFGPPTP